MAIPPDFFPSSQPPPSKREQESKNALLRRFRKILHLSLSEKVAYKTGRSASTMILDTAATITEELMKGLKKTHNVNLATAIVVATIALPALIRRVKKTAGAVLECRSLNREITIEKKKLASTEDRRSQISLEIRIERLEKRRRKYLKQIPAAHKIFIRTVEIAAAAVIGAYRIGSLAHKLSEYTSAALCSAATVLGTTIGAIGIVIGGFEITRGVQKALRARKRLHEIQNEGKGVPPSITGVDEDVWKLCTQIRSQKLSWQEIHARRAYTSSILRACNGALATVGGALAIAGVFTMGWTAIALGIVALAIGFVEIGVGIGSHIRGRQLKAKMQKEQIKRDQIKDLGRQIVDCTPDQKREIAQFLGIENVEDFAISPTKLLKHEYGKVIENQVAPHSSLEDERGKDEGDYFPGSVSREK